MLCNLCKKNHATFQKFVTSVGRSVPLCGECLYKTKGSVNIKGVSINITEAFTTGSGITVVKKTVSSFPNGISDIRELYKSGAASGTSFAVCTNCATDFETFKKSGKFGCSECYSAFEKLIMPVIKQIHG